MKRDFSKLEITDYSNISQWLKLPNNYKPNFCPFRDNHKKCHALFPSLKRNNCPCAQFRVSYVVKVANKALDYLEGLK